MRYWSPRVHNSRLHYIIVFYRPQSTTDQVYGVIRSLIPIGHGLKTIKMDDIEDHCAAKVRA